MSGIVFQSFHLIPTMTALENVAVRWSSPASPTPSAARAMNSLRSDWAERLHHYPAQLSGGEQQRVRSPARLRPIPRFSSPMSRPHLDEATGCR